MDVGDAQRGETGSASPPPTPVRPGDEADVEEVLDELSRVNNDLLAAQRALERKNAEVDRASERLTQLLGMAAHDLRNPAGSIRGLAQTLLLRARDRLEEGELEVLERIVSSSNRMLRLVHDLLDLSASEHSEARLERAACDLRAVVDDALDVAAAAARDKDIALHLAAPPSIPMVADAANLQEVLLNLLTNAIKYSPRGSTVEVTVEEADDDVRIRVADHGVGIPEDELPLLFQPFSRTSSRPTEGEPSTGLGLAIADRVVRGHGGHLAVASELGTGSVFTVTLPGPR